MIRGCSDHAANERTFVVWMRTGIAVVAFGFVVEEFNLFMATVGMNGDTSRRQADTAPTAHPCRRLTSFPMEYRLPVRPRISLVVK